MAEASFIVASILSAVFTDIKRILGEELFKVFGDVATRVPNAPAVFFFFQHRET